MFKGQALYHHLLNMPIIIFSSKCCIPLFKKLIKSTSTWLDKWETNNNTVTSTEGQVSLFPAADTPSLIPSTGSNAVLFSDSRSRNHVFMHVCKCVCVINTFKLFLYQWKLLCVLLSPHKKSWKLLEDLLYCFSNYTVFHF